MRCSIVANFLMFGAALALIKPCVKLFSLPRSLLMTLIIPICIIGAYSVRTNMFDVWVMVAGGFIGYAFYMFKFPAAPVVLGVILAPLADENLRRALLLFDNNGFGYLRQGIYRPRPGRGHRLRLHRGLPARAAQPQAGRGGGPPRRNNLSIAPRLGQSRTLRKLQGTDTPWISASSGWATWARRWRGG